MGKINENTVRVLFDFPSSYDLKKIIYVPCYLFFISKELHGITGRVKIRSIEDELSDELLKFIKKRARLIAKTYRHNSGLKRLRYLRMDNRHGITFMGDVSVFFEFF